MHSARSDATRAEQAEQLGPRIGSGGFGTILTIDRRTNPLLATEVAFCRLNLSDPGSLWSESWANP
jgi:hypothetical protein